MINYSQRGDIIDWLVAGSSIAAGEARLVGGLFFVSLSNGQIGDTVAAVIEGVVELAGEDAEAFAVGDKLYWNGTKLSSTPAANTLVGVAVSTKAASADLTVKVKLGQAVDNA